MQLPHSANSRIAIVVVIVIQFMIFNLILSIFALFVRSLAYEIHVKQEAKAREHKEQSRKNGNYACKAVSVFLCVKGNKNAKSECEYDCE